MRSYIHFLSTIAILSMMPFADAEAKFQCPGPSEKDQAAGYWTVLGSFEDEVNSTDMSGLDCRPNGDCLMVDDEIAQTYAVNLDRSKRTLTIKKGRELVLRRGVNNRKPEADLEAVAATAEGFIVVGSHGNRGKPKFPGDDQFQSSRFALYLPNSVTPSAMLNKIIIGHPELDEFYRAPLAYNGVNIEGLAEKDGYLFVGFRSPIWTAEKDLKSARKFDQAYVLEVPVARRFDRHQLISRLHRITLTDGEGIRGMASVDGGFLLLTGPASREKGAPIRMYRSHKKEKGLHTVTHKPPYRIVHWRRSDTYVTQLAVLEPKAGHKPEAILVLDQNEAGSYTVLIVHDSAVCGGPREIKIGKP